LESGWVGIIGIRLGWYHWNPVGLVSLESGWISEFTELKNIES